MENDVPKITLGENFTPKQNAIIVGVASAILAVGIGLFFYFKTRNIRNAKKAIKYYKSNARVMKPRKERRILRHYNKKKQNDRRQ